MDATKVRAVYAAMKESKDALDLAELRIHDAQEKLGGAIEDLEREADAQGIDLDEESSF